MTPGQSGSARCFAEDLEHLPPHELAESILAKEKQIAERWKRSRVCWEVMSKKVFWIQETNIPKRIENEQI